MSKPFLSSTKPQRASVSGNKIHVVFRDQSVWAIFKTGNGESGNRGTGNRGMEMGNGERGTGNL